MVKGTDVSDQCPKKMAARNRQTIKKQTLMILKEKAVDTPDAYIETIIHTKHGPLTQQTDVIENETSPEWNQQLKIIFSPTKDPSFEFRLKDRDLLEDDTLGIHKCKISTIPQEIHMKDTVVHVEKKECHVENPHDLKCDIGLSEQEINFIHTRRELIYKRMKADFGDNGPTDIAERQYETWSEQRRKLKDGKTPFPILSCINVKSDETASEFHEWVEFSPYQMAIPKYEEKSSKDCNEKDTYKKPGIERKIPEELEQGCFSIFDDENKAYDSMKFHYTQSEVKKLIDLVEFNTELNIGKIKKCIEECVKRKQKKRHSTN
ncbi:hypothetical protein KUTeg_011685 [Tegillarca granosa]|uniref:Phospholipase A2 n=1 Tax=Tegillarca granosa TaxID=220873 RepID=A0ABQ9F112_TEGGR|nr:hypothetical protein KUTeg_011685 [Tegillarca granosa]